MLNLKLQYFGHLMQRANSLKKTLMLGKIEDRRRRRQQRMRWLDGIIDSGHEFEQALGVGDGQGGLMCCLWRWRKSLQGKKWGIQSFSCVQLFATLWTAAHQPPLSFTISQSLLKFISIESMMSSNHLVLCWPFSSCLQSCPKSGSSLMSQLFASGGQSIGASGSASVLSVSIQGWFPLGLI